MAIGWFICPYKRGPFVGFPSRQCAMNDFTTVIRAEGGDWSETEILGDRAIVKVRASPATLSTLAGTPNFRRIPRDALDDPLSALNQGQRNAIRNEIQDAGYTLAELSAQIPDLAAVTLRQVLRFMTTRRLKPRYDKATDTIILDGPVQPCRAVESVDEKVR